MKFLLYCTRYGENGHFSRIWDIINANSKCILPLLNGQVFTSNCLLATDNWTSNGHQQPEVLIRPPHLWAPPSPVFPISKWQLQTRQKKPWSPLASFFVDQSVMVDLLSQCIPDVPTPLHLHLRALLETLPPPGRTQGAPALPYFPSQSVPYAAARGRRSPPASAHSRLHHPKSPWTTGPDVLTPSLPL